MTTRYESSAESTTIYVAIPEGRRVYGRVKEVLNTPADPDQVHPGKAHPWREMLHYGQPGTGFVECICGAIGVPYKRTRP